MAAAMGERYIHPACEQQEALDVLGGGCANWERDTGLVRCSITAL